MGKKIEKVKKKFKKLIKDESWEISKKWAFWVAAIWLIWAWVLAENGFDNVNAWWSSYCTIDKGHFSWVKNGHYNSWVVKISEGDSSTSNVFGATLTNKSTSCNTGFWWEFHSSCSDVEFKEISWIVNGHYNIVPTIDSWWNHSNHCNHYSSWDSWDSWDSCG